MDFQVASNKHLSSGGTDAHSRLSFYLTAPSIEVSLEEFEQFALDRLRVLKSLEEAMSRGRRGVELEDLVNDLWRKYMRTSEGSDVRKDVISHFVLRLVYCRSDELRKWFLAMESSLFRHRFQRQYEDQGKFMEDNQIPYRVISISEFEVLSFSTALSVYWPVSWFHRRNKSLFPQKVRHGLLWVKAHSGLRVFIMAEKRDENLEEGSSSHGTEKVSLDEDALFKAQLVSFMETFQQFAKHPKMQELLQALKTSTQTQKASSHSLQLPSQSRFDHLQRRETSKEQRSNEAKGKGHVVEQPTASIGHRQPSTHGLVNGQDSNEQTMRQTIPMPTSNVGCFGGGSVFQAMIRPSPALHGFMPNNAYGAMQVGSTNPMYGNIGVQRGFQCAAGS
ncbi:hypothetical protein L7F22_037846 [Adiantum nelumboides]|nr:hypothetical protein [Adiantum nelumboides]